MWAALGRLGVAQAVGLARVIAVRPAGAAAEWRSGVGRGGGGRGG